MATKKIFKRAKAHQRYRLADGTIVPGVTTIVGLLNKPYLVAWANKMGLQGVDTTAYTAAAAGAGTCAHEMIQAMVGGTDVDFSKYTGEEIEAAQNAAEKFRAWLQNHDMQTHLIEEQLVSERYRVGGTIDWYGELDGRMTLVDIKTSGNVYAEHIIQVAAYAQMLKDEEYPVDGVRILRFSREDNDDHRDFAVADRLLKAGLNIFLRLREVYDLRKEIKI